MDEIYLQTRNLSIGYHSRIKAAPISSDLNLHLKKGCLTCLIGPNGIGKSTLLRTLAGLQQPLGGQILIEGIPLMQLSPEETAKRISIVLTHSAQPGDLKVGQVVALGRLPYTSWLGVLSKTDFEIVESALSQVNALHLIQRNFGELSDGERQKVMVARAIAQQTPLMILDEPTAFLDWGNRVDLLINLKQIAHASHKSVLISSHDLELVLQIVDEVWLMAANRSVICGRCDRIIESGLLEESFSGKYRQYFPKLSGVCA